MSTKFEPTTSTSVSSTVHLQMPQMYLMAQQAMVNGRPVSFHYYVTKKAKERDSYFQPSKKQRVSAKQEITINIGVMELNKDGVANILSGKTLPLKISKEADYKTLLESALPEKGVITTRRLIPIVSTKSFIKMANNPGIY